MGKYLLSLTKGELQGCAVLLDLANYCWGCGFWRGVVG